MHEFINYLEKNKHKAGNTLIAYRRDLESFRKYLEGRDKTLDDCTESDAVAYVMDLGQQQKSRSTINRKVSSLRTFYEYKMNTGARSDNPFHRIKTAKGEKRQVEYFSEEEIEKLMAAPDDSDKGLRDRALMEFMYGTGARVTEVVRLKISDINLRMGFVTVPDANDESRIVPLGDYARDAISEYMENSYRHYLGREPEDDDYIFVNFRGQGLTRQGIWRILKNYGDETGLDDRMSPQIFRDSFAVHVLRNGGDLKTLQELMGFDDMSIGIAYLSAIDVRIRDVFFRCHPRAKKDR